MSTRKTTVLFLRRLSHKALIGFRGVGDILPAEDQGHDQADADAKGQREDDARQGEIRADGHAGVGQGQDVGGRGEKEKGDGRPQPSALFVDAGKEGHDGAGAHGQHAPRQRRRRIGDVLGRVAPQEARDGLFGHQGRQAAGDEKGRQQAEQDVRRQVGGQVAQATLE